MCRTWAAPGATITVTVSAGRTDRGEMDRERERERDTETGREGRRGCMEESGRSDRSDGERRIKKRERGMESKKV